jgi:hypothetical protein
VCSLYHGRDHAQDRCRCVNKAEGPTPVTTGDHKPEAPLSLKTRNSDVIEPTGRRHARTPDPLKPLPHVAEGPHGTAVCYDSPSFGSQHPLKIPPELRRIQIVRISIRIRQIQDDYIIAVAIHPWQHCPHVLCEEMHPWIRPNTRCPSQMLLTQCHKFPIDVDPVYALNLAPSQHFTHSCSFTTTHNQNTHSPTRGNGGRSHYRMNECLVIHDLVC